MKFEMKLDTCSPRRRSAVLRGSPSCAGCFICFVLLSCYPAHGFGPKTCLYDPATPGIFQTCEAFVAHTSSLVLYVTSPNTYFWSQSLVKPTVAKSFLASMTDLNHMLLGSTCNFVRCIKPNAAMQCGIFNNR